MLPVFVDVAGWQRVLQHNRYKIGHGFASQGNNATGHQRHFARDKTASLFAVIPIEDR